VIVRRNRFGPPALRMLFDAGTATGLTDGQLLERFATRGGDSAEAAFAALVDRHGPMVWRVCRAILRDDHDAEDAFQATFLVLVRRAGTLWVRDSLGPWLHRVASRAAARARVMASRRRAAERRAIAMSDRNREDAVGEEVAGLVHAEIDRLPERYRMPVVLCDVEGRSYEEAARHLRCPVGTVKSRLARGRERLRGA
jgi:RNA polymerase sigma factor (sigma-70 family)